MSDEGEDGYLKGSITRIKLKNFLTYSSTEFFPGPNMNMVIGPNGTGKSTVVCAIALGLGGTPEVLGRAKDVVEFIKHGENIGRVEIELKNSPKNSIIRRSIDRESGQSKWRLDGKSATLTEVKRLVASFSIQVDNLCQFLPQDKVSGFAQMDPSKLLRETERAAGKELLETHDLLSVKQTELKVLVSKLENVERELRNLQEKNDRLEPQVARLQERETIDRQIELVEVKKIIAQYTEDVTAYTDGKALLAIAADRYEKAISLLGPLKDRIAEASAALTTASAKEEDCKNKLTRASSTLRTIGDLCEKKDADCEELASNIMTAKKKEEKRKEKIQKKKDEVLKNENLLKASTEELIGLGLMSEGDEGPRSHAPIFDTLSQKRDVLEKKLEDWTVEKNTQEQANSEWARECGRNKMAITQKERDLASYDAARIHRHKVLKENTERGGTGKDVIPAVEWLRENQHLFKGRVFEPVILEIEAMDPKYAAILETAISFNDQISFTCELEEDFYTFRDLVVRGKNFRVNWSNATKDFEYFMREKPSMAVLKQFGLDGVLIDKVTAHPVVMRILCEKSSLHKIAYCEKEMSKAECEIAERSIPRFFNGIKEGSKFHITKSAYNSHSTRFQAVPACRFLVGSGLVDTSYKVGIEQELGQLKAAQRTLLSQQDNIKKSLEDLRKRGEAFNQDKERLREEKRNLEASKNDFQKKKMNLSNSKMALENLVNEESFETQIAGIHRELLAANKERVDLAIDLQQSMKLFVETFQKDCIATLKRIEFHSDVTELKRELDNTSEESKDAEKALTKEKERVKNVKAKARESHKVYSARKDESVDDPEIAAIFDEGLDEDETFESLDTRLCDLEARAALIARVDPEILTEYNNRKKEIAEMDESVESDRELVNEKTAEQKTMHDEWKAELEEIVGTISASFSSSFASINCVGEVQLREDEEKYSNWGIEILVKFRSTEKLQVLTAQRQSGGERSVSTMLYLIALQSLSKSPFRVVDEINQGMDPRNERLVHKLIVKAACEENASQYFLITPKLLPDLEYHERMRVLCIYNGYWQPETWDLQGERFENEERNDRSKRQRIEV